MRAAANGEIRNVVFPMPVARVVLLASPRAVDVAVLSLLAAATASVMPRKLSLSQCRERRGRPHHKNHVTSAIVVEGSQEIVKDS